MSDVDFVQLNWSFEPESYLGEAITFLHCGIEIKASKGKASANFSYNFFVANEKIAEEIDLQLSARFSSIQLTTHRKFSLIGPSRIDVRKDGGKVFYAEVRLGCIALFGTADVTFVGANGEGISDSKRDRAVKQEWLAR